MRTRRTKVRSLSVSSGDFLPAREGRDFGFCWRGAESCDDWFEEEDHHEEGAANDEDEELVFADELEHWWSLGGVI